MFVSNHAHADVYVYSSGRNVCVPGYLARPKDVSANNSICLQNKMLGKQPWADKVAENRQSVAEQKWERSGLSLSSTAWVLYPSCWRKVRTRASWSPWFWWAPAWLGFQSCNLCFGNVLVFSAWRSDPRQPLSHWSLQEHFVLARRLRTANQCKYTYYLIQMIFVRIIIV